jgi:hypothetical protein
MARFRLVSLALLPALDRRNITAAYLSGIALGQPSCSYSTLRGPLFFKQRLLRLSGGLRHFVFESPALGWAFLKPVPSSYEKR